MHSREDCSSDQRSASGSAKEIRSSEEGEGAVGGVPWRRMCWRVSAARVSEPWERRRASRQTSIE